MLDEHSPVFFSSAFAPFRLANSHSIWGGLEEGRKKGGRDGGGREEWTMGVPSIEADEAAASSLSE